MFERSNTINGVAYAYQYGGNGTIRVTAPVQALIDLKQMPQLPVTPEGPMTAEQEAHLQGALQSIIGDMMSLMPGR